MVKQFQYAKHFLIKNCSMFGKLLYFPSFFEELHLFALECVEKLELKNVYLSV